MCILRTSWILQEVLQGLCKDGQAANLINQTQGQFLMDTTTTYSLHNPEGSHYTGTYLMLP